MAVVNMKIDNFHAVDNGLFRCGILTTANFNDLIPFGIKSIISMKTNVIDNISECKLASKYDIDYLNIPIMIQFYSENSILSMRNVYKNMCLLRKPLLVHCTRGADRTGIAIAMHRILQNKWDFERTIAEMDALGFNQLFYLWKDFLYGVYKEANNQFHGG